MRILGLCGARAPRGPKHLFGSSSTCLWSNTSKRLRLVKLALNYIGRKGCIALCGVRLNWINVVASDVLAKRLPVPEHLPQLGLWNQGRKIVCGSLEQHILNLDHDSLWWRVCVVVG